MNHLSNQWFRHFGNEMLAFLTDSCQQMVVFIVDENQKIIYWSKGAENILGFSAKDTLGQHCLTSIRCIHCMKKCSMAEFHNIDGKIVELFTKDGTSISLKKYTKAFLSDEGEFLGGIEMLRPVENTPPVAPLDQSIFHGMLTRSPNMKKFFNKVRSVAHTDIPVLARGESGTGKELLAQAIHQESDRRNHPFVAINCSAIPENLIESELFGHIKGAFTGAHKDRKGLFEQAHKGTLFLDEIAELPLNLQAKLLRILETQTFKRVGDNQEIHVDVRIIAATHKSLRQAVKNGTFREDLMYRLRVVPIFIPALRERKEDIELLFWHFIRKGNEHFNRNIHTITPQVFAILKQYEWPGNIRELRNVVDYVFAMGTDQILEVQDLPMDFFEESNPLFGTAIKADEIIENISVQNDQNSTSQPTVNPFFSEKDRILQALELSHYHLGKTADLLQMSRATLWRKRKQYDI